MNQLSNNNTLRNFTYSNFLLAVTINEEINTIETKMMTDQIRSRIKSWGFYNDIPTKVLFFHLLLSANLETSECNGEVVNRGEINTFINHLSNETNLTYKQIRRALGVLKSCGEITVEGRQRAEITICNFDDYMGLNLKEGRVRAESKPKISVVKKDYTEQRIILNSVYTFFDADILRNLTEANKIKWLETIEKLNRLDGYSNDTIEKVITFGRQDDFWKKVFLSVAGLRDKKKGDSVTKFQKILKQMENEGSKTNQYNSKRAELAKKLAMSSFNDPDFKEG